MTTTKTQREITIDGLRRTVEGAAFDAAACKRKTPIREVTPFPGLFWYSGFGYGDYFSNDGNRYWTSRSEAHELARLDGLKMEAIDSLEGYQATYLGD